MFSGLLFIQKPFKSPFEDVRERPPLLVHALIFAPPALPFSRMYRYNKIMINNNILPF